MKKENKLNIQKRIYEVSKILDIGHTYLDEIIKPQLLQVAVLEDDFIELQDCAAGSYLITSSRNTGLYHYRALP